MYCGGVEWREMERNVCAQLLPLAVIRRLEMNGRENDQCMEKNVWTTGHHLCAARDTTIVPGHFPIETQCGGCEAEIIWKLFVGGALFDLKKIYIPIINHRLLL